jgi:hypothetical protein
MTNTELLAMLTATVDRDAIDFDPDASEGLYIDWSTKTDGGRQFEIGANDETVTAEMTWSQIARLQQALTLLLLEQK